MKRCPLGCYTCGDVYDKRLFMGRNSPHTNGCCSGRLCGYLTIPTEKPDVRPVDAQPRVEYIPQEAHETEKEELWQK